MFFKFQNLKIKKFSTFSEKSLSMILVLEESIHNPPLEIGFNDEMEISPLIEFEKCKKTKTISRPATPEIVDEIEPEETDEFELFFTLVSDDGLQKSGKDLEIIWDEILDMLQTGGNFPGAAPKELRPDVYKGKIRNT